MTDLSALHRRYSGPIPTRAAIASDAGEPWAVQLANRRQWSWMACRRIGRECLHHRREALRLTSAVHHNHWLRLRHELAFALRSYKSYRDWSREAGR